MKPPKIDAARFGSIHSGDTSHRGLGYRPPRGDMPVWNPKRSKAARKAAAFAPTAVAGDVWSSAMDTRAARKARKARNVPCPVCARKLKSKSGVNTHRKAMGH